MGGSLDAFLNANELNRPPKFDYSQCYENDDDDCDYHSPLMACWFKEDEIAQFEPANRYMTGKTLIERWSQYPEIQPHAYIYAKINESQLMGRHPIMGLVLGARRNSGRPSPLETALFALADVEDVEAEDFGVEMRLPKLNPATFRRKHPGQIRRLIKRSRGEHARYSEPWRTSMPVS